MVLVCCHGSLHIPQILSFAFLTNLRKVDVPLTFRLIFNWLTQLRRTILMGMMKTARSFFEWLFMRFSIRFNFDLCRFVLPAWRRRVFCVFMASITSEEVFIRCNKGSVTVTIYIDTFSVHGEYNYFMIINKTILKLYFIYLLGVRVNFMPSLRALLDIIYFDIFNIIF